MLLFHCQYLSIKGLFLFFSYLYVLRSNGYFLSNPLECALLLLVCIDTQHISIVSIENTDNSHFQKYRIYVLNKTPTVDDVQMAPDPHRREL